MVAAIKLNDLSKQFKENKALSQLNLTIESGQVFGFLGENGAGKTTTIKLILGLIKADGGSIELFGQNLNKHRTRLMGRIGSLIESPSYYPHLSGLDNLRILAKLRAIDPKFMAQALKTVNLLDAAHKTVKTYSHGMKQRLGIAMAILGEPDLVILDEPTNGLDPSGIRDIRQLILSLPKRFGTTVFVSSHLLSEMEQMVDRVGILKKGRLLFNGPLTELRAKASPYILVKTKQIAQAAEVLGRYKLETFPHLGNLHIQAGSDEIQNINQTLVSSHVAVLEIREVVPSLEDLYFELTSGTAPWV